MPDPTNHRGRRTDGDAGVKYGRAREAAEAAAAAEAVSQGLMPAAEGAAPSWWPKAEVQPPMGRDSSEQPKGIKDQLPDWVGFVPLYLVSIAPVLIAIAAISILFFNSLK